MKCPECGAAMTAARENYKYDASGLPNVTLQNVEVRRCSACGEVEVAIPRLEGLHREIARFVSTKPERLTPAEVRFLRKSIGWSGVDFAKHMGVSAECVSRWETGKEPMGAGSERALRLMVAVVTPAQAYPIDVLANLTETAQALRLAVRVEGDGWHAAATTAAP